MSIVSAIVLFAVIWFLILFIVLPFGLTTQGDTGVIEPGTQAGAPAGNVVRRKLGLTTVIAVVVWATSCGIILSGWISISDFDLFSRFGPPSADGRGE